MFHPNKRFYIVTVLLFVFIIALAACSQTPVEVTRVVEVPGAEVEVTREVEVPVEVTRVVEVMVEPEAPVSAVSVVPFEEKWVASAHADITAEAFIHWNEDDPKEVPVACAKCHSTPGFQDFTGADGSAAGVVDAAAPIGTVIECQACHNDIVINMDTVIFPSGAEVSGLGAEARCMTCHQGRASTVQVNEGIVEAGLDPVADLDTVSPDVGFTNIHYFAAAATQYGTIAKGGYEYDGKAYDSKFDHVEGYDTCASCHDPHSLEVKVDECQACHTDVETVEDFANIRMVGSLVDYNGNGDMEEGIYAEIEGLRDSLFQAIQAYATEIAGAPIVYDQASYPYFFTDTDNSGAFNEGDERYATWTPRLAKAAYNFQVSLKDPGRYAHGGKYIIQLLYDSMEDLNLAISTPIDMSAMSRIDYGHFAGSEEAFRHWDEDGAVPGSCSRCHSATGLPLFLEQGVTINQPTSNGLNCATCHADLTTFELRASETVKFPSGVTVSLAADENDEAGLKSNLCINCHQGRESTVSVNAALKDLEPNTVSDQIRFRNVHYFAAAATLFGTEVKGAYEYDGLEYLGRNEHVEEFNTCVECHNAHALEVEYVECAECHENVQTPEDLKAIRVSEIDFDGDGDLTEGIYGEIATVNEVLYAAIQAYAVNTAGAAIVYNPNSYPYFFADDNGNGTADEGEGAFASWTPELLKAAYNYQYGQKDPGAYAHNGQYVLQFLMDSIIGVGGSTDGMTRPSLAE